MDLRPIHVRKNFIFLFLICFVSPWAEAGYYLSFIGARLNLDYKNIKNAGVISDTQGTIELVGLGGGYTTLTPGNFGYEMGASILGTNSEKLTPPAGWGIPWYYRLAVRGNYAFSFGLFFEVGADLFGSFYQDVESHYLGLGVLYGLGYRINERMNVVLTSTNNSVLFPGDNTRYLRGQVLEYNLTF